MFPLWKTRLSPNALFLECLLGFMLFSALAVAGEPVRDSEYRGGSDPIWQIDGDFGEITGLAPNWTDTGGDQGASGIDLGSLWLGHNAAGIYLHFEVGRETVLNESAVPNGGNDLVILIDGDANQNTGRNAGAVGAELELKIGDRQALAYNADGTTARNMNMNRAGWRAQPTHSETRFEAFFPFVVDTITGNPFTVIQTGSGSSTIRIVMVDEQSGDRLPDAGYLSYTFIPEAPPAPEIRPFAKADPNDVRILCHNVLFDTPIVNPGPYSRYLTALQPDIIAFQEVFAWSAEDAATFVATYVTHDEQWFAAKNNDCITVSKWPITQTHPVDGNLAVLIDMPAERSRSDLVIINAHTPCCANNFGRDIEHDNIAVLWRDLLNGVGPFRINPQLDAVVMAGDFNMVGFERQVFTLRDGNLIDNATNGADFLPGRSEGSLVTPVFRHTHSRSTYTWRTDGSQFPPGRLDWVFVSPDVATVKNHYALWTPDIPVNTLNAAGLQINDSPNMSDHLVLVTDLELAPSTVAPRFVLR